MKKETIFRHELNESIQANAALNCLKNRNKPQQMNEALPLVAGAIRLAMPLLRPLITKLVKSLVMKAGAKLTGRQVAKMVIKNVSNGKTLMKIGKKVGQTWTEIPAELKQEIAKTAINTFKEMRQPKQPQLANQEQEESVDYAQLADDVCASYRGPLSKLDLKDSINYIVKMVAKKIGKTVDALTPEELTAIQKAAKHSVWYVSEQEEMDMEGSRAAYYSQDEPDYEDDSHGIRLIINMLMQRGDIIKSDIPRVQEQIKSMLDAEGMWIGDDESEAERFIEMYWDNQEQEEDGINKGGMHNSVQVGHIMNTPSMNDSLDTEYFSDLEEQEAYYENFRAIAELVADQIDKENGKDIANNMDTLFAIVREVWNNNPDDLYIWDFDDVQEDDCYKFFDKYYETIKDEYLKREHNNIMDATHDDLFAS